MKYAHTFSFCRLTSQFRFCGNCFRLDSYRGCTFGCIYCFVNAKDDCNPFKGHLNNAHPKTTSKAKALRDLLEGRWDCFEYALVKSRIPFHFGGISDPFNHEEAIAKRTLSFLKVLSVYEYPVMISTKGGIQQVTDRHLEFCDPKTTAFQISLLSTNQKRLDQVEVNTPSAKDRIALIQKLRSRGYWVSVRIQPLIWIEDALALVKELSPQVNYITVEHLKLMAWCKSMRAVLQASGKDFWHGFYRTGMKFEVQPAIKFSHAQQIKEISKCPIGIGDNDLHWMSDSDNCCGLDTIGGAFSHWLSYNTMTLYRGKKYSPVTDYPAPDSRATRVPEGNKLPMKHFVDGFVKAYGRKQFTPSKGSLSPLMREYYCYTDNIRSK